MCKCLTMRRRRSFGAGTRSEAKEGGNWEEAIEWMNGYAIIIFG
jgi:hypothetical protein